MVSPPRVLPALLTPFDADYEIDVSAHVFNVKTLVTRGISGVLVAGSTGEGPYLEPGERAVLAGTIREEFGDDVYVMCGIAAESVRQAMAQIDEVARVGCDGVLVMTPTTLVRGNHGAVAAFYRDVADAVTVPVLLYSVPRVTGYELPTEAILELATHPNIVGMKDSGGRPVRIQDVTRSLPDGDFLMYAGASAALAQSLAAGGHGAITASCNYVPELVTELVEASDRDHARAHALQAQLTTVVRTVEAYGNVGTKAAAGLTGLSVGHPRPPLHPLGPTALDAIEAAIRNLDQSLTKTASEMKSTLGTST